MPHDIVAVMLCYALCSSNFSRSALSLWRPPEPPYHAMHQNANQRPQMLSRLSNNLQYLPVFSSVTGSSSQSHTPIPCICACDADLSDP